MHIENELGTIGISNDTIATIAANVARNCFGVRSLTTRSPLDGLVQLLKREVQTDGVQVKVAGAEKASIDLHIAVNYGVNILAICQSIASEIKYNMKELAGMEIDAVNIFIDAVKA